MESRAFVSFGLRLVAWGIDMLIISVAGWILGFIVGFGYVSAVGSSAYISWVGDAFGVILTWLYFAGFESSVHQATFGKRILGIKVTDMNGSRINFGRATARYFAKVVSVLTLGIGFLMILFTKKRQGLHDLIAKTLVIKK